VVSTRRETPHARTLALEVPSWPGHVAGQHLDVRLTAPDGYQAYRSYSVASATGDPRVDITVELVPDGEVSSYLVDVAEAGDAFEVRGPIGGYFTWRPEQPEPVLLVAGGAGIVPLMAMLRARDQAGTEAPFRLVYSVRAPDDVIYADELERLRTTDHGVEVAYVYTRQAPAGSAVAPARLDRGQLAALAWPEERSPTTYVCGPTGFVETVADLLVDLGQDDRHIKTERFGPTGGAT
jgi:ferredoxin-NADP reductase